MYIVISQTFDRFAQGVRHRLVGIWVDDEDPDRRHFCRSFFLLGREREEISFWAAVVRCGIE